ncbi:hypothetical protein ASC75_02535 [Aminobacter sp. DSM 101952]|uniref:hypothetical protein n=1 Tax=Aminobacter sp. DSM 101952 TaxID=2735891 RepID=UPI0006F7D24A|nr:hypothetical protein [Aminobacter sp. DSM 101952]KQU76508.1 hypothetical protein ASC75_02535 [Aminobacter sp. DSM 101952]
MKDVKSIDWIEAATFYESRLGPGMLFDHLSQAVRHAVNVPLRRQHDTARIVTQSGSQYGWQEINVLHHRLRASNGSE